MTHVLITGASRGIGRAIALELAGPTVTIAVHFREREDTARETLAAIRERGGDGIVVQADLAGAGEAARLLDHVGEAFGALDVLVHNARPELRSFYMPPLELTEEAWRTAIESQAGAFLAAGQAAGRVMRDGGRIVAITYSPSTRLGSWQPWAAMGSAKAAMESLVRYFAVALGPRGITVNAVSPGWTYGRSGTPHATVLDGLPAEVRDGIREWHEQGWTPMLRTGTPEDVAGAVALLCDARARFITGQVLHVDGGASVMDPLAPLAIQQG